VYLGQRYYDPETKRFIGIDPVDFNTGNLESFNRYTYANNNPYKFTDPDGRQAHPHQALMTEMIRANDPRFSDRTQIEQMDMAAAKGSLIGGGAVIASALIPELFLLISTRAPTAVAFATEMTAAEVGMTTGGAYVTANSAKYIVLGEGMGAVKAITKRLQSLGLNTKWYQAWSKNFPTNRPMNSDEMAGALARNERWLRSKIKEGYKFIDIGIDATRAARSPFYQLEQEIIKDTGTSVIKVKR